MTTQTIDQIAELLHRSDLSWLLPALRQDCVVWEQLNEASFFEQFNQKHPPETAFVPEEFSPGRLAFLALKLADSFANVNNRQVDPIYDHVLQLGIKGFESRSLLNSSKVDLATAGLIAMVIAYKVQSTSSWKILLDILQEKPDFPWESPIACLYSLVADKTGMLTSLVQPGVSNLRFNLAVHAVLSNPILPNDQVAIFMQLCHGLYGDPLPSRDRFLLLRSLHEQNPAVAQNFGTKWLEIHPVTHQLKEKETHPLDNIDELNENLFQIEIRRISGRIHHLAELLAAGTDSSQMVFLENINCLLQYKSLHGNPPQNSSVSCQKAILFAQNIQNSGACSKEQAELALTLSAQGFTDEAKDLLPNPDASVPNDPAVLYGLAVSLSDEKDTPRVSKIVSKLLELLDSGNSKIKIPVWGEHLSLVNLGKLFLDLRMPSDAAKAFENAVRTCPNDITLLEQLAECYHQSHQERDAADVFHELVVMIPADMRYHRSYAATLEQLGDWETALNQRSIIFLSTHEDERSVPTEDTYAYANTSLKAGQPDLAISTCADILSKSPEDSQALILSGLAQLAKNDLDRGMEFLVRATQVAPELAEAWIALANAQKKVNPIKDVIETLKNACQAVPNSPQIMFALGDAYLQDDTPAQAESYLQSAVQLTPDDPLYLFTYARVLKLLGHLEDCRIMLSKAFALKPDLPGLASMYGKMLVELGELEAAVAPLEMLISSKTITDPLPYLDYARCILTLNQQGSTQFPPMKALAALNEALQVDPDLAEAKGLTAEALSACGEKELAFQAYREALDSSLNEDKDWRERLSFGLGRIASSIGKHDIAIAALQEAAQVNPNNPDISMSLSDAYLAADLLEDSIRSARNVLIIAESNPDHLAWFARQCAKVISDHKADGPNSPVIKQITFEALNALEKAIQLAPTRTDLLVQLGSFQSFTGADTAAQATFASIASLEFAAIEDLKIASSYLSEHSDHVMAIACLENGIKQDQPATLHDSTLYLSLAQQYVNSHDHTSAINTLDKAIELIPGETSLILSKVDILLGLGQSIEALSCIEKAVQKKQGDSASAALYFIAAHINRVIGNFASAIQYARSGLESYSRNDQSFSLDHLSLQQLTQIAEIYRALIQPDLAYQAFQSWNNSVPVEKKNENEFLDFICLHTELALETGEQILSDLQDIDIDAAHPSYSRWMAIKARLLNKAGNYKQAEQLYKAAVKSDDNLASGLSNWSIAYDKYLTSISLLEAAIDLGKWDQADAFAHKAQEISPNEPLTHLNLARILVHKAEFNELCKSVEVTKHKPSVESTSQDAISAFMQALDQSRSSMQTYQDETIIPDRPLTSRQLFRWQSRAQVIFETYTESGSDPAEVLTSEQTPADQVSLITYFHQQALRDLDSGSINRIIKIARSSARNPAIILQAALALIDSNPSDAMKSLQTISEQNPISKNPPVAFCNVLLAKIASNNAEAGTAQLAIESAIEFWPDEPSWHTLAAQIYKQASDSAGAIHHLEHAVTLEPKNIQYEMDLGQAYFENGNEDPHRLKQALKIFENVLALAPKEVNGLFYAATTQFLLNDLENADINARNALMEAPHRADIYQLLSEIAVKKNDFQGAYEYANKAIQINPKDIRSSIVLARSLSALGRHNEALARLSTLIPSVPDAKLLQLEQANIMRIVDGVSAGMNALKQLVVTYPDDFLILNNLAKAYIETGEIENGINSAIQALQMATEKTSRNDQANLHLLIGQAYRKSGDLDQSILHLNDAIQLAPDRLEPYLELGLARKERREYQQALQIFERATNIAPEDPRALFQAGLALKESKDYKSSETMLRRAVSLAPNDLNIRRQLAAVVALNLVHNPRSTRN